MTELERPYLAHHEVGPDVEAAATTSATLRRRRSDNRARRVRRWAERELDDLVSNALPSCCCCRARETAEISAVDVFHDGKLGVPEREARGRELLAAGFVP